MQLKALFPCLFIFICLARSPVYSQSACERLTTENLGTSDMLSTNGLVSEILTPEGDLASRPPVRIIDMKIVCEAQHMMQDRYRYTSVVVSFNCESADIRLPECSNSSVVNIEQLDLGCDDSNMWTPDILTVNNLARSKNPNATLTTELETNCILCINPSHPQATTLTVDSITHCVECADCTMGLQRCYYDESFTEVCCNYFQESACVEECPGVLVPNTNNECGTANPTSEPTSLPTTVTSTDSATTTAVTPTAGCGTPCVIGLAVGIPIAIILLVILVVIVIVVIVYRLRN